MIAAFIKKNKPTTKEVTGYLRKHFDECVIYEGDRGDSFPESAVDGSYDMVLSYISPWIIPPSVLNRTKLWNINFHPGPPEYPGIGCFNFAIYNQEKTYGVTAHLMNEKVDTGKIVRVKRFPLLKNDSVLSLSKKSYENMMSLFTEVMDFILKNNRLPQSREAWKRVPYTRKQLEELCRIEPGMKKDEIRRRISAVSYPDMPGAYVELYGNRFEFNPDR